MGYLPLHTVGGERQCYVKPPANLINNKQKGNSMTIEQIIRWFVDTDGYEFAEQIYGKTEDDFHNDGYVAGKFRLMQKQPIHWMIT